LVKLLQRYEQRVQRQVEADRAAGGSGFFTVQAHWFMWSFPLFLGSAVGVYLIHSTLGRLLFDAPFLIVSVVGMTLATRGGFRAKR